MNESILNSIKHAIGGIVESDTSFDQDIIMHINTILMILMHQWYGEDHAFTISDSSATWADFLKDSKDYEGVKSYVALRVRLLFDPPSNSFVINAMNEQIRELEWHLFVFKDNERLDALA